MSLIGCPPKFQCSRHNCNRPHSELKVIPAEEAHSESDGLLDLLESQGMDTLLKVLLGTLFWRLSCEYPVSLEEAYNGDSSLRAEIGLSF